jgi:uncharacterized protein
MRRTVILMLKQPRPGRVKTRLAADIGSVAAAWWFRHRALGLIRRLRDPRWRLVLAVAPDAEGLASRVWPRDLARIPQGKGDLGRRMRRLLRHVPDGPVCLIGADIPALNRGHVWRAFGALGRNDAVFGPATDGGYWLVGLKRGEIAPRHMFERVRWSTSDTLADTIASVPDLRMALVDRLQDVDTRDDLRAAGPDRQHRFWR